ncbi:hypothetical protein BDR26DRAFT_61140 [Obelidium mucronatum]|nr:hypothetical protein BDR26DRAFT_61140 [Obelidium mucronatum]
MKVPLILLWCALSAHAFDMVLNRINSNLFPLAWSATRIRAKQPQFLTDRKRRPSASFKLWPFMHSQYESHARLLFDMDNIGIICELGQEAKCVCRKSHNASLMKKLSLSLTSLSFCPFFGFIFFSNGGEVLLVNPGDSLQITFQLIETTWHQTITLLNSNPSRSVHYEINLQNQTQGRAEINVELYHDATQYFPVTFKDISLRVSQAGDSGYCFNRTGTRVANLLKSESCSEGVLDVSGVGCLIGQCRFEAVAPVPEGASVDGGGGSSGSGSSSDSNSGSNSMGANGGTVVGNGSSAATPSKTSDSTRLSFVFRTIILYITTCILITS